MEGSPRTHESDVMQFCVIAIEIAARKMGISPSELVCRLESQDLIEGRLMRCWLKNCISPPNVPCCFSIRQEWGSSSMTRSMDTR